MMPDDGCYVSGSTTSKSCTNPQHNHENEEHKPRTFILVDDPEGMEVSQDLLDWIDKSKLEEQLKDKEFLRKRKMDPRKGWKGPGTWKYQR